MIRHLHGHALFLVVIGTLLLTPPALADSDGWSSHGTIDGMRVDTRDVSGSSFKQIRIIATNAGTVQAVCDAIFAKGLSKPDGKCRRREIVRETDTDRWIYEQIQVPLASDRDFVIHVTMDVPPSTGRCELTFREEQDPRPSPSGVVRMVTLKGHWKVEGAPGGPTTITYEVFSDPGGGIPAFLAGGPQREAAADFVKTVLARVH